jgi:hypothetical protein
LRASPPEKLKFLRTFNINPMARACKRKRRLFRHLRFTWFERLLVSIAAKPYAFDA